MSNPFPGMDPYLEQHWRDVHHRLITYASDQLQPQLPQDLLARVEERVVVEPTDDDERSVYPDVRIVEHGAGAAVATRPQAAAAGSTSIIIHADDEPATEGFIEIVEAGSARRVVTVLEILSLTNKLAGEGREIYRRKQRELKAGRVTLVEIDLLRAGRRTMTVPTHKVPQAYRTAYQVCVRRGWRADEFEVYPVPLRERLPDVRVPLRETDSHVVLKLQELIDRAHQNGRYETTDYRVAPVPPLRKADAAWAVEVLRRAGMRDEGGQRVGELKAES